MTPQDFAFLGAGVLVGALAVFGLLQLTRPRGRHRRRARDRLGLDEDEYHHPPTM